jgi:hypothetical protein
MSKELPFLKFFPTEWLIGKISFQPLEVQGAFIQCVCICWQKNGIFSKGDVDFRIGEDMFERLLKLKFIEETKDGFYIKFLEEQISEFEIIREKRRESGSYGGKAKAKQNIASAKQMLPSAKQNVAEKKREEEDKEEDKKRERDNAPPLFSEFYKYAFDKSFELKIDLCEKQLQAKYMAWVENGWKTGKNQPIKNWKTTLLNTLNFLKKEKDSGQKEKGIAELSQKKFEEVMQQDYEIKGFTHINI